MRDSLEICLPSSLSKRDKAAILFELEKAFDVRPIEWRGGDMMSKILVVIVFMEMTCLMRFLQGFMTEGGKKLAQILFKESSKIRKIRLEIKKNGMRRTLSAENEKEFLVRISEFSEECSRREAHKP